MSPDIKESDWKIFRDMHDVLLARFCDHVLAEIGGVIADNSQGSHARYGAVYKLIHQRDKDLADAFDDLRRSTALLKLTIMRRHGLMTDEEFGRFSPETRETVARWLSIGIDR